MYYFDTEMIGTFSMAMMHIAKIENALDEKLILYALDKYFDLDEYENQNNFYDYK